MRTAEHVPGLRGLDLKFSRLEEGVELRAVAKAMGITSSRLSRIEGEPRVTVDMHERYTSALETCRTSGTSEEAA